MSKKREIATMTTEEKDVDMNTDDSGNSCGSSVVSDLSGPSDQIDLFDGDGVQVSDLEEVDSPLPLMQVSSCCFLRNTEFTFTFISRPI